MAERTSLRDYQRELADRLRSGEAARTSSRLGIQAGNERWLVDLADAGEVVPVPPITPVPLTRAWLKGVTNIRGNLYSVVDFSAFTGGAAALITDQSRLLLIGNRFRSGAALLIDRSLGLRNMAQLRPHAGPGADRPWVKGELTDADGGAWKVLDVLQLVRHPEFMGVAS